MAKKIKTIIKLQAPGGQAVPGQKLGPVLGSAGVNIGQFVQDFNAKTKDMNGMNIPCILTVYEDRTYSMEFKKPPVTDLIKKEINLKKGSGQPNKSKVGKIKMEQVKKIAEIKMPDLNTTSIDSAMKIVIGSAKSMGLEVIG
ncbi:50S ribosomal protein L11 [bacterium]|nr:MAG: 50S ribosomal protein L11 [bacterium]